MSEIPKISLGLFGFNDYVPDVWEGEARDFLTEFFDASVRHLLLKFGVQIEYTLNTFKFHSTPFAKELIDDRRAQAQAPGYVATDLELILSSTIADLLPQLSDAQMFIGRHPFATQIRQQDGVTVRYEITREGDRSFMHPAKWIFLYFDPMMETRNVLWSAASRFDHELCHLIPYLYPDIMPFVKSFKDPGVVERFDSGRADFPPYNSNVDQVWDGKVYSRGYEWKELFEDKYPVQGLDF